MRLAVIGDVHLISDRDPHRDLQQRRRFFKDAWPSFVDLLRRVEAERPDQIVFLGDLVDWHSTENLAFALDVLSRLHTPWLLVPGNHDLEAPVQDGPPGSYRLHGDRAHRAAWADLGVDLSDRRIDAHGWRLLFCDNALSDLPTDTASWLAQEATGTDSGILFTHVPIDLPSTRAYILGVDPHRSMTKYVLSREPDLFERHLAGRMRALYSGHLHFGGDLDHHGTAVRLCSMGITMFDPNRQSGTIAEASILDLGADTLVHRRLVAA